MQLVGLFLFYLALTVLIVTFWPVLVAGFLGVLVAGAVLITIAIFSFRRRWKLAQKAFQDMQQSQTASAASRSPENRVIVVEAETVDDIRDNT